MSGSAGETLRDRGTLPASGTVPASADQSEKPPPAPLESLPACAERTRSGRVDATFPADSVTSGPFAGPSQSVKQSLRAVDELIRACTVVRRRDHPQLASAFDYLIADGRLVAPLPGVYSAPPGTDLDTRICAAMAWDLDAVITGAAAARLSFWPKLPCPVVDIALPRRSTVRRPGFRLTNRPIPAELVAAYRGLRLTIPALTALDLCPELGGDAIDAALRTGAATLPEFDRVLALTPARAGNELRRELVRDSRDEPWSPPERRLHRLLRAAGITGWRANVEVRGPGWRYYPDVAFEAEQLDVEVDGREHHIGPVAFEWDRQRQNRLVRAGWVVLRFTPTMIDSQPEEVIDMIQGTLHILRDGRDSENSHPAVGGGTGAGSQQACG